MIFLTADLHFSHANIIEYTNRPFKDTRQMDDILIRNWNSIVNNGDTVYVLGDFSMRGADHKTWFAATLKKLKGTKILVLGNHDKLPALDYVELGFQSVHTSIWLEDIFLAHDPAWSTSLPIGSLMCCGHVHQLFTLVGSDRRVLNVGVDVCDYKPISFNIARELLRGDTSIGAQIDFSRPFDRHEKNSNNL
jgi:calcineurin-like phosphoesterase family protein